MRVSTLIRWLWRLLLTGLAMYGVVDFFPPMYWPWRWMDFFEKAESVCTPDTNFVIIDVGHLSRTQIAMLLQKVAIQKPKVIAMDLYFAYRQDSIQDSLLRATLCQVASEIPLYLPTDIIDAAAPGDQPSTPASDPFFASCARKAFANLLYWEDLGGRIVRYARLYHQSHKGQEPSLAWAVAQHLDSTQTSTAPPEPILPIRYGGNISCFYFLVGRDLLMDTTPPLILSQKAIFIGFADPLYKYTEDLFFTPLGVRPFTLMAPDMYGVVIHANIALMAYHKTFWKKLHPAFLYGLGLIGLFLIGLLADVPSRYAYLWVRIAQVILSLLFGALFASLSHYGYWVDAELSFLILLIGGETCLLTASRKKSFLA